MVAVLAVAGLGEVARYESARAELMAINPAWSKATLFTTMMPFILSYVHQTLLTVIFERYALPLTLK